MVYALIGLAIIVAVVVVWPLLMYKGPSLTAYDLEELPLFHDGGSDVSEGLGDLVTFLKDYYVAPDGLSRDASLAYLRKGYEHQGNTREFESTFKPDTATFDGVSVAGEWTIPPSADPDARILFVHGGAFLVGSPISHRPITDNLARRTGCAVFAVDYRLGPEHPRMDGIIDCQTAYQWVLDNGPDGQGAARVMALSGDSAGGNLILMLTAWARDKGLRAVDAAAALSPATDATGQSRSMRDNIESDPVLGKMLGPLIKLPLFLRLWIMRYLGKINPSTPLCSPVFFDLHDLPPTLVQASSTEMLRDDGVRYAQKARQAGSPVTLQIWRGQAHVWQHYDTMIPEAAPALDEIAAFFEKHGVKGDR